MWWLRNSCGINSHFRDFHVKFVYFDRKYGESANIFSLLSVTVAAEVYEVKEKTPDFYHKLEHHVPQNTVYLIYDPCGIK